MKRAENIIVGISIGDLNGIGSEVVLKTFEEYQRNRKFFFGFHCYRLFARAFSKIRFS